MKDKNSIIKQYEDYEDKLFVKNIISYCEACIKEYSVAFYTDFLDPRQQSIIIDICKLYQDVNYKFNGGIEDAERRICSLSSIDYDTFMNFPVDIYKLAWKSEKKLSHRDFLGSLIHTGIKREKIGDIIVSDNNAFIAVHKDISQYIFYNLTNVGNTSISILRYEEDIKIEQKTKLVSTTVSSLRLDCIISAGFGLSRTDASEKIKASKVFINWEEEKSTSSITKKGDHITLRGMGRIVLEDIIGTTKNDRIKILIKKFI